MGIPAISPYPMPSEADVPDSVAAWRPDPRRALLLIHDMQRYFVDAFPAGQPPVTRLLSNVARIRRAAARHRLPVVYTAQQGGMSRRQRGLLYDIWGPGMGTDPVQRQIVAELAPARDDVVLDKVRYSAFHRSNLAEMLVESRRDQLIVCGVYAHIGCLMTACDAFSHDIEAFLVADAVADLSLAHHRMALAYAAQRCAVTLTTRRLLAQLKTRRPHPLGPAARVDVPA